MLKTIKRLLVNEKAQNQCREQKLIPILVSMLNEKVDDQLSLEILKIIVSLTLQNPLNQIELVNGGIFPILIKILQNNIINEKTKK